MSKYIKTTISSAATAYEHLDIKNYNKEKEFLADYQFVFQQIKNLLGKMLTVVDATYTDKEQKKAVKDIIKGHWSDTYCFLGDMMFDKTVIEDVQKRLDEGESFEPVDVADI